MVALSLPALAQVPALNWVPASPTMLGRSESQGAGVGTRLYVIGGFYNGAYDAAPSGEVYDASTDSWTAMADMPEPLTHAGTAEDGDNLYLAGGYVGRHPGPITDHVWRYHTPSNTWSAFVSLPAARGAGIVARVGRELHFCGGAVRVGGNVLFDAPEHWALSLDAPTPTWVARAPLPAPTNHLGGTALNGKLYVMGGQLLGDESFGNQSTLFEYDPATDAWTTRAPMPRPLGHLTSSVFPLNNRLVVVGGRRNGPLISEDVIEYNPATDTWRDLTALPIHLLAPVAGVAGGRLVVNGGEDGQLLSSATWRSAAILAAPPDLRRPVSFGVWPNPAAGGAGRLLVETPGTSPCQVVIRDALGRVQVEATLSAAESPGRYPLAVALRPGLYSVALQQGPYAAVRKLVVE